VIVPIKTRSNAAELDYKVVSAQLDFASFSITEVGELSPTGLIGAVNADRLAEL
jgi:hypothetical protein